jgi:ADP-heptose:LPS heptosyltransferase
MQNVEKSKKLLILRLSSFGDVVIARDVLRKFDFSHYQVDWVIKSTFQELIKSPDFNLNKIHIFPIPTQTSNLKNWMQLARLIRHEKYDEVVDLQYSLRTILLRLFLFFSFEQKLKWHSIRRGRLRRGLFFIFKKALPLWLRPKSFHRLCLDAVSKVKDLPLKINHAESHYGLLGLLPEKVHKKGLIGLMPSSAWTQKCWPVVHFVELAEILSKHSMIPVVLGKKNDERSQQLVEALKQKGFEFQDKTENSNYDSLSHLLKQLDVVVANDTGILHFAEDQGVPVIGIYGPTHPDLGYAPRLSFSQSVVSPLWCSPCSSDGTRCFRIQHQQQCLSMISANEVFFKVQQIVEQKKVQLLQLEGDQK